MEILVTIQADKLANAMHELAVALQGAPIRKDFEEITPEPQPTAPVTTQPAPDPQSAVPVAPQPTVPPVVQTAPAPVAPTAAPIAPTSPAPTYTLDQLAQAAAVLRDAGKLPQLQNLLQQFGVQSMQQLPPERYGEFATALRGLGAKI